MRTSRGTIGQFLTLAALVLLSSRAGAEEVPPGYPPCDRTPTEGEVAAAKGAFQAGTGSFNEADYERAITYWEDAYRRDCTAHPLLLNLARAYELNGQKKHAVAALETFLERSPDSAQAAQIQRRIEKLKEQIREDEQQQRAKAAPSPAAMSPAPAPPPPTGEPPPAEPEGDRAPAKRSIAPLFVAGGGGVLAIVGSVVFFVARSDVNDFESTCGKDRRCTAAEVLGSAQAAAGLSKDEQAAVVKSFTHDGNAARTRMNVGGALALVGVGAAVGGTLWYFLQPGGTSTQSGRDDASRQRGPRLVPTAGPGFAGLRLSGSF